MNWPQIGLMLAEIVFVTLIFLTCFRLRRIFGLVPVYTMLGVVFYTCGFLAESVFVQVAPGVVVSPGTVALFPAIMFVVLCVYITHDADEARKLLAGLFITNIFLVGLGWLTALHLSLPGTINAYHLTPALFQTSPRIGTISVIALIADTLLIILLYEYISRFVRPLILRVYFSMALTLTFDTIFFITGAYVESPDYLHILVSSSIGKLMAAIVYAVFITIYLTYFDVVEESSESREIGSMFRVLTYRQKYEMLQARSVRDPLTGTYNRAFFDEILSSQAALAKRAGTPTTMLMVDIDHFKNVNDDRGHPEGDRVLRAVAEALSTTFRSADYVCRYGGEEFAVILPNTGVDNAIALAEKARARIEQVGWTTTAGVVKQITATLGVAVLPTEVASVEELISLADSRLYDGKRGGRNRVVAT